MQSVTTGEVIWRPSPETISRSRLAGFMERHGVKSYPELLKRAELDPNWFWDAAVRDIGIRFDRPYQSVVDLSRGPQWAQFWPGAEMNIVASCIDQHLARGAGDRPALIFEGEPGDRRRVTYSELNWEVGRFASALQRLGLTRGERVGIFMPMTIETAIAILACAKIGLVFIPLFSGFGAGAVAARLQDCEARALICADGYFRRGQMVAMKEIADRALLQCPSVKHLIMCRRVRREVPWMPERDRLFDLLMDEETVALANSSLSPQSPLMILYTSGTTGTPKGAYHVHGGFPVKAALDLAHAFDMGEADVLFWYSDIGWMMGPWMILGALALGGCAVLYEGAPDHPGPDRIWSICDQLGVSILGVSPTLVRALMAHGTAPVHSHPMTALRVLGGTGEPWNPAPFKWFFEHVGRSQLPVINYSGGTEISGGILAGNVLSPLRPCSFAGPLPGMAAAVLNDQGQSVRGEVGELSILQPWPGMTQGFWRDPDRYLETYWSRFPGVWVHGDWAYVADDGLWYLLGRSDDTIKLAGKRLGPAEVESVLVAQPEVLEAAAIGVPDPIKGEVLVCFCVLKTDVIATDGLRRGLVSALSDSLGKALAPSALHFLDELPRTRNAKILRRLIKAVYLGLEPGDVSALDNPGSLAGIGALAPEAGSGSTAPGR
ncbi:MAG TPA: AMP-binding protein [Candidatus Nitrosotalea sp.]|nr:AMP-binding protein [Candidatus Nitrosotalea sp.]